MLDASAVRLCFLGDGAWAGACACICNVQLVAAPHFIDSFARRVGAADQRCAHGCMHMMQQCVEVDLLLVLELTTLATYTHVLTS